MELKNITISDLKDIQTQHAVIVVSDGKMKLGQLPAYGNVNITCHEKKVKQVKEEQATKF
ncbi:MAG: XtrA/YqaO family protein [Alkalibacterium sp.]|uniref:Uncharacterized protein n=1 Tax=Tetragenococcus halophilus (strain DSM 20338 / JCM 20259 / NCIMB 9735 / NBRC 12172) TaxID=945021 RepID=A0AAN1SFT6_TETHN|nr:XtrA/YqaO family protein [Tetragenococcus halophilus]MDN6641162.1 XtrA/YqaO family protein [Tetragenococcus sp.]MDN6730283.1 XtrA/YqaO family protein [Alkalibacterium sp.]BAK94180.1 hypothetical protein TEH_08530 [Tetragenococcus halophilus NBRC 12172]GBD70772.1 putative uncharacterized protein [Tetragenococcus halophilus subsp. halophilus]GBD73738.1 putative uncharacterized protein [Tetragenococcus halophilus subsp. halophilus]